MAVEETALVRDWMGGWMTPPFIFLLITILVATIALASISAGSHRHCQDDDHRQQRHLHRALSRGASALHRLRSFNFNHYYLSGSDGSSLVVETAPPSLEEEVKKVSCRSDRNEVAAKPLPETLEAAYTNIKRSQSDTPPVAKGSPIGGGAPIIRKAASETAEEDEEEDEEEEEEDEEKEVDARADDFINMFRKQLQLQRLESSLRYRRERERRSTTAAPPT